MSQDGPSCRLLDYTLLPDQGQTYDLVESLSSAQASWACADDEHID